MIHMVLVILKIIGWILLAAAGLLLAALLAVLFVPVRYRAEGRFYGQPSVRGRVSWLLGVISVRFAYEDGGASGEFRIAGIPLGGSEKEEEESGETEQEEAFRPEPETRTVSPEEPEVHTASLDQADRGSREKENGKKHEKKHEKNFSSRKASSKKRKTGVREKLRAVRDRIRKRLRAVRRKLTELIRKKERIMEMIRDERNRKTFRLVRRQLGKVIRHIRPGKIQGKLTFGFDDPYRTGQALSAAALLCPVYRNSLQITPVFDRSVLEGELQVRGRIRLSAILFAALRLLMDRNFRRLAGKLMNR